MEIKALTESVEIPKGSQEEAKEGEGVRDGVKNIGEERWGCLTFELVSSFITACQRYFHGAACQSAIFSGIPLALVLFFNMHVHVNPPNECTLYVGDTPWLV